MNSEIGRRRFERRCELRFELKPAESEAGMPAQFCCWCLCAATLFSHTTAKLCW